MVTDMVRLLLLSYIKSYIRFRWVCLHLTLTNFDCDYLASGNRQANIGISSIKLHSLIIERFWLLFDVILILLSLGYQMAAMQRMSTIDVHRLARHRRGVAFSFLLYLLTGVNYLTNKQ